VARPTEPKMGSIEGFTHLKTKWAFWGGWSFLTGPLEDIFGKKTIATTGFVSASNKREDHRWSEKNQGKPRRVFPWNNTIGR